MLHRIGVKVESESSPSCVGSKTRSATYPPQWDGIMDGTSTSTFLCREFKISELGI